MKKIIRNLLFVFIAVTVIWWYVNKDQIRSAGDFFRLAGHHINSLRGADSQLVPWKTNPEETVRIASFNIQVFGAKKAGKPEVIDALCEIVRKFDLVAIQEIRSLDQSLIPAFVEAINSNGRHYAYVVGPRTGRNSHQEQYAYIYDQQTIQMDMSRSYQVNDPDDLLRREPYVGWFRTKNAPENRAFTFSLTNVHLDSSVPEEEVAHLDQVFRAVRNDGRGEDDVIILGDFNVGDRKLQNLAYRYGLHGLISNVTTNTRGSKQYDNIIIAPIATSEFTGRSGVYDFMKEFDLSLEEALAISDHLPVWAEFSVFEGGHDDQLANRNRDSNVQTMQLVSSRNP